MIPLVQNQSLPATRLSQPVQPVPFLAIDVETCHVPEPDLQAIIDQEMSDWAPPGNFKDPVKIEERRQETVAKLRERSALLDCSPIACVAVRTPQAGFIFSGLGDIACEIPGNALVSGADERGMLIDLREFLTRATGPDTVLIGFNLRDFDLPRLRAAYMRHRLRLPKILAPTLLDENSQPTIDVARLFLRWFTSDRRDEKFISLAEVSRRLNLPGYKDAVDGSAIPDLIARGEIETVLRYCCVDVLITVQAYLLMTSAAAEMA